MNVVFFGGSSANKEYFNEVYNEVLNAFKGKKEYTIVTGGTIGTMEAVGKAANETGIKLIGVLLSKYEGYLNKYNTEIKMFDTELERLKYMIELGDMYICLDGDLGTLAELFPTFVYTADVDKKLYIVGDRIKEMLEELYSKKYITYKLDKNVEYIDIKDLDKIIQ